MGKTNKDTEKQRLLKQAKEGMEWKPKLRAATFADKRTKRNKTRQTQNQKWKDEL